MTTPQNSETPSALNLPMLDVVDAECETHGPFKSRVLGAVPGYPPMRSRCPVCEEQRRVESEAIAKRREADARRDKVQRILGNAGIPPRFQDRTFGNYAAKSAGQKIALAICRKFAETWPTQDERGGSLVLTGNPGTGKTHLACAVAGVIAEANLATSHFCTVVQMLRHIKETYRRDSERSEQDAINDLVQPALLIVDEVGVQNGSDHEKMLLFEVLNERYQRLRPTILISNLSGDELEQFVGQRIMDRYRECGSIVAFDWVSYRGGKSA